MPNDVYAIRLLAPGDVDAYLAHARTHEAQAAEPGELPRGPYSRHSRWDPEEQRRRTLERWTKDLDQPGWRRVWARREGDRVVGVVSLTGPSLDTMLHRCEMGIGIQLGHRGKGWGRRLVTTAVNWATEQAGLDWVDLGVFEGNHVAMLLYQSLGFRECGRVVDCFRVDGLSVTDVRMTLRVDSGR